MSWKRWYDLVIDRSIDLLSLLNSTSTRPCFFFSSRRRHTSSYGDWSSDVCLPILRLELGDERLRVRLAVLEALPVVGRKAVHQPRDRGQHDPLRLTGRERHAP